MNLHPNFRVVALLTGAGLLGGCMVGPTYDKPTGTTPAAAT